MRCYFWVLSYLLITALFVSCYQKGSRKDFVVGMDLSYPPFEMIDTKGDSAGISVELAQGIADFIDRPLRVENIPFIGLVPALKSDKVDLIISSMSATEERRKVMLFSDPYWKISMGVLSANNSSLQSTDLEELDRPGRKIAVRQGTIGEQWALKNLHHAQLYSFDQEASAVMEVQQGKVDGFIYDQLSVLKNAKCYPGQTRALLQPFAENSWVMGIRLGNNGLQRQVNAFLKQFRERGGFEELKERYLREVKEVFLKEGIPF